MKQFYFIGGPKVGKGDEFFRRLVGIGGTPPSWRIYPHASNDGKALHIAVVESQEEILVHLRRFDDIYEWGKIEEILGARLSS